MRFTSYTTPSNSLLLLSKQQPRCDICSRSFSSPKAVGAHIKFCRRRQFTSKGSSVVTCSSTSLPLHHPSTAPDPADATSDIPDALASSFSSPSSSFADHIADQNGNTITHATYMTLNTVILPGFNYNQFSDFLELNYYDVCSFATDPEVYHFIMHVQSKLPQPPIDM